MLLYIVTAPDARVADVQAVPLADGTSGPTAWGPGVPTQWIDADEGIPVPFCPRRWGLWEGQVSDETTTGLAALVPDIVVVTEER